MNLKWCQVKTLASIKSCLGLQNSDLAAVIGILMKELLDNMSFHLGHIALHHFTHCNFIPDVIEHIWEFRILNPIIFLQSDEQILFLGGQKLGASNNILEMLKGNNSVLDGVYFLECVGEETVAFLDLVPVDKFESFWVWVFHFLGLFFHDVTGVEGLNSINANRNELLPADQLILILISECNKHIDIIIIQSVCEHSERISELIVGKHSTLILVHALKHFL